MSSLILFQPGAVPAHIAAGPVVRLNENAFAGLRASFATISIEGKAWTIRYRQVDTMVRGPVYDHTGAKVGEAPSRDLRVAVVGVSPVITKQWYKSAHVPGSKGAIPECFSTDGVTPDAASPLPQAATCAVCPHNVFGSRPNKDGTKGKGKACGDNRKIAVVPAGDPENALFGGPMLLRLPPTSMPNFATYCGQLEAHGYDITQVITTMRFDEEAQYSEIVFAASDLIRDPAMFETCTGWAKSDMVRRMLSEAPAPEAGAAQTAPAQPAAPPRMTYVDHAVEALEQAASDPRAWVLQLIKLIGEAPTLADVEEMQGLDGVKVTYQKAPPAVIADINEAFAKALQRLGGTPPSSAAMTPTDEAGEEHDAPGAPASGEVGAFVAWLVDHDGEPIATRHGSGTYTDPVAYAEALVHYLDHEVFPADVEKVEKNNEQDAIIAGNASPAARAILFERQKRLAAGKAADKDAPASSKPAETLMLPPPAGNTKAAWTAYTEEATAAVAGIQTEAVLDAWVAINRPTYDAMQTNYRMTVKQAVSIRRSEIAKRGVA